MTAQDALRDKIARALAEARAKFEGQTERNVKWEYWSPQTQALFLHQADAVLAVLDLDTIRAEAWDEGHIAGRLNEQYRDVHRNFWKLPPSNPYRKEKSDD